MRPTDTANRSGGVHNQRALPIRPAVSLPFKRSVPESGVHYKLFAQVTSRNHFHFHLRTISLLIERIVCETLV